MPVETLSGLPSEFAAGDTVRFRIGDARYPATTWTMAFTLRNGTSLLTVAGAASGNDFTVALTAAQTILLTPGVFASAAVYSDTLSSDKAVVPGRSARVTGSLTVTTVGPRRTAYNAARAALDAALLGDQSYSFNGQSATSYSLGDLQKTVDRLYMEALAEDRALGISNAGGLVRIVTRM